MRNLLILSRFAEAQARFGERYDNFQLWDWKGSLTSFLGI